METKNEYSIKISGINSGSANYRLLKNEQDIDSYDLTIEELELFQKELSFYSEMFRISSITFLYKIALAP